LIAAHLFLMRRHGISGPVRPPLRAAAGPSSGQSFYPHQAARDLVVILIVSTVIAVLAAQGMPALERMADPTDATYVPRPEWYFLGLFQLLKYMPGKFEIFGALVLPGLVVGLLALLPWLDRGPDRRPQKRPIVLGGVVALLLTLVSLTVAGWSDRPARLAAGEWSVREVAGAALAETRGCVRCHGDGRVADPLDQIAVTRPVPWLQNHFADPEVIAPGIRPLPPSNEREGAALIAFVKRGGAPPQWPADAREASVVFARHCIGCHTIDGDGGGDGPDLSRAGRKHGFEWLRDWIARPEAMKSDAEMPAFDEKLSPTELARVAKFLAVRR
jgi:mono/diheme cytochrome c family protein